MLYLPTVTQVVIDCVDVIRAEKVIAYNLAMCEFASSKVLSSQYSDSSLVHHIPGISSLSEYSTFCLRQLIHHVDTEHVLVCQHDGFIRHPSKWDPVFLQYDYVGAPWLPDPTFVTTGGAPWCPGVGPNVGNGGFSLRSRRLQQFLSVCPILIDSGLEDVDIAVNNRPLLDRLGFRFAPEAVARNFSWETGPERESFGTHGRFVIC